MEQQIATPTPAAPPADPDAAKYEALRQELGIEKEPAAPEPAAEPAAEPAVEPDGEAEPEQRAKPSYEELEERQRRTSGALKEAKERAQAAQAEKQAILDLIERSRRQQPVAEPKKDEPAKIPDVNEDPIGHFKAALAERDARIERLEKGTQQSVEQMQTQAQHQQLLQLVQHSEAEITAEKNPNAKPDYWEACAYLEGQRERELARMYPDKNPDGTPNAFSYQYARSQGFNTPADLRQAVLNHDRWAVAVQALQLGIPPAEYYYSLATDRGYETKSKVVATVPEKGKQQIEALKKGRAASVSISGATGRKGTNDMSVADLAQLSIEDPEAFDKAWDEMRKAGRLG